MFNFEKLDVWQKAIEFAGLVYTDTRRFPTEERFGLTTQLRRAAVSISRTLRRGPREVQKLTLHALSKSRVDLSSKWFPNVLSRDVRIFSAMTISEKSTRQPRRRVEC